jgi:hypothetical protein
MAEEHQLSDQTAARLDGGAPNQTATEFSRCGMSCRSWRTCCGRAFTREAS